jgi:hypothetical protein
MPPNPCLPLLSVRCCCLIFSVAFIVVHFLVTETSFASRRVSVGIIQLGWDTIHMNSTISSTKDRSVATSSFLRQPIVPTRIRHKRVIIGRNIRTISPTPLLCPSFTITPTILLLNQGHVSMGKLRRLLVLNGSPSIIFLISITDASLSLLQDRLSKVDGLRCRLRASLSFQESGRLL